MAEKKTNKIKKGHALDDFKLFYEEVGKKGHVSPGLGHKKQNKIISAIKNFFRDVYVAIKAIVREVM